MKLALQIWKQHIEVFESFDLVCHNGNSLEDETKSNALFNTIVTLKEISKYLDYQQLKEINEAIDYLKGSKYYSDSNCTHNKTKSINHETVVCCYCGKDVTN